MTYLRTGGCQCGTQRYEITAAPRAIYTCHCTDCQRRGGSAFSTMLLMDTAAFHLTGPEPRAVQRRTDSGRIATRWVCSDCTTAICGGSKPGTEPPGSWRVVLADTLDDTSWVRPTAHFWTRSKQRWVLLPAADRQVETQPDNPFEALLRGDFD